MAASVYPAHAPSRAEAGLRFFRPRPTEATTRARAASWSQRIARGHFAHRTSRPAGSAPRSTSRGGAENPFRRIYCAVDDLEPTDVARALRNRLGTSDLRFFVLGPFEPRDTSVRRRQGKGQCHGPSWARDRMGPQVPQVRPRREPRRRLRPAMPQRLHEAVALSQGAPVVRTCAEEKHEGPDSLGFPLANQALQMVGATGFEPATTCTPSKCATRLRYAPKNSLRRRGVLCPPDSQWSSKHFVRLTPCRHHRRCRAPPYRRPRLRPRARPRARTRR